MDMQQTTSNKVNSDWFEILYYFIKMLIILIFIVFPCFLVIMKEMHNHEKYVQQSTRNADKLLQEEEQEKLKVERQKERKRKKKERKKAVREATKGCTANGNSSQIKNGNVPNYHEGAKSNDKSKKDTNGSLESPDSSEDDDNEAFLDVNSAFVTKVVKHKLRNNANNGHVKTSSINSPGKSHTPSSTKQSSNGTRIVPIPEKNMLLGERLAVAGYQFASKENYDQAIELFTRALRNVPNDHRYWGNRSFCYFQIGSYQK